MHANTETKQQKFRQSIFGLADSLPIGDSQQDQYSNQFRTTETQMLIDKIKTSHLIEKKYQEKTELNRNFSKFSVESPKNHINFRNDKYSSQRNLHEILHTLRKPVLDGDDRTIDESHD